MDGVINVNKPKDMTSFDVVAILRTTLNTKKIGHTGTLDPDATGVLPICVGKATKLVEFLTADKKQYKASVKLGVTTDTQDMSGTVLKTSPSCITKEELEKVINSFLGEIEQIPPMYSAIKIDGKKLYELAREGKTVERKPRKITIFGIKLLSFDEKNQSFDILVNCSKGTYIRTLANDIGESLGCGAALSSLLRTVSGNFCLENSFSLEKIKELCENGDFSFLTPLSNVMNEWQRLVLAENNAKRLLYGIKFNVSGTTLGKCYRIFDENGNFLAVARCGEEHMEILKTFFG